MTIERLTERPKRSESDRWRFEDPRVHFCISIESYVRVRVPIGESIAKLSEKIPHYISRFPYAGEIIASRGYL